MGLWRRAGRGGGRGMVPLRCRSRGSIGGPGARGGGALSVIVVGRVAAGDGGAGMSGTEDGKRVV